MAQPLINGSAYSYANIQVNILGVPVFGVTKISYKDTLDKQNLYGQGSNPIERGVGNYSAEASITLTKKEYVSLINAAPNRRLQDIPPFSIVVTYINANNQTIVETLRNVEFMTNGIDVNQGDAQIEVNLDLILSHIDW